MFSEIRQAGYVINLTGVNLVNTVDQGDVRLDLTGLNFSGVCQSHAQIGVADMEGVDLSGADFSDYFAFNMQWPDELQPRQNV